MNNTITIITITTRPALDSWVFLVWFLRQNSVIDPFCQQLLCQRLKILLASLQVLLLLTLWPRESPFLVVLLWQSTCLRKSLESLVELSSSSSLSPPLLVSSRKLWPILSIDVAYESNRYQSYYSCCHFLIWSSEYLWLFWLYTVWYNDHSPSCYWYNL